MDSLWPDEEGMRRTGEREDSLRAEEGLVDLNTRPGEDKVMDMRREAVDPEIRRILWQVDSQDSVERSGGKPEWTAAGEGNGVVGALVDSPVGDVREWDILAGVRKERFVGIRVGTLVGVV